MNCEQAQQQLLDYLHLELTTTEQDRLDAHVAQCADCQEELQAVRRVWQTLGAVPEPAPSENLRPAFYSMLASYKEEMESTPQAKLVGFWEKLRGLLVPGPALRLAYSLGLLVVGLAAGYWLRSSPKVAPASVDQKQLAALTSQVEQMRQVMLLSLIENPSATERLRAVSYTKELSGANDKVIEALLSTLNHDENVNVRLATLEALAQLAHEPKVRLGLVQALKNQDSPLVQSALADVMVQLQERRSVQPLRRLLQQPDLNEAVKSKIKESIQHLSTGRPAAAPSTTESSHEATYSPQPASPAGLAV
ncbi:HEAT repeat domain-containing protein [Hymenobacter cellulosilyticus]|uniref:HEAT repeat domain-containing protein n=1 Tax=Hymenobacter cellulosilyticus TaxID=2932248 RepID=A0A8T9Q4H0_9BACT|nr:HEAT repeat domain-containing protein [Hymenobacter cellulosilyticus]UOQ70690.1 HEAT repeat domain-containing protein [Hymenobacter cellulosilyticus]